MYNTKKGLVARKSKEWDQFIKKKQEICLSNENSIIRTFNSLAQKYGAVLLNDELYIFDKTRYDKTEICNICVSLLNSCSLEGERLLLFDILVRLRQPGIVDLLIEEFYVSENNRWEIGDLLYRSADIAHCPDYLAISSNTIYGTSRQMVVLIFGKLHYTPAIELLIRLLDDEDVYGHALSSLSKIANLDYISYFYNFSNCEISWIRKIAVSFINKYTSNLSNNYPNQ